MKKDELKKVIQTSRQEKSGIDALISPSTKEVSTETPAKKKIKTLTIDESYHSKIRQIAANDGVKLSEVVYDAFNMYFKYRNIK